MVFNATLSRRAVLGAAALTAVSSALPAGAAPARQLGHEKLGTGPEPVLMLHEWLGDHQNYHDALPYLSGDKYSYVIADLRGYGRSKHLTGEYTVKEAASDALALMDSLGHKRFFLAGHSMSGMIAQYIAMTARDRVKALVLTSPVPPSGFKADEAALAKLKAVITDDEAARQAIDGRTGKRYSPQWLKRKLEIVRSSATPEAMQGYLAMFTSTDFAEQVKGLDLPVSVIAGEYDVPPYRPDAQQQTLGALYPHLTVTANREAGHYSMLETPVLFASLVEKALAATV